MMGFDNMRNKRHACRWGNPCQMKLQITIQKFKIKVKWASDF